MSLSPAGGKKNFSFCKSRFRFLQLEEANVNEINHDIHLANTLFQKGSLEAKSRKYQGVLKVKSRVKFSSRENMTAVCNGISLFMLTLMLIFVSKLYIFGFIVLILVVKFDTQFRKYESLKLHIHRF